MRRAQDRHTCLRRYCPTGPLCSGAAFARNERSANNCHLLGWTWLGTELKGVRIRRARLSAGRPRSPYARLPPTNLRPRCETDLWGPLVKGHCRVPLLRHFFWSPPLLIGMTTQLDFSFRPRNCRVSYSPSDDCHSLTVGEQTSDSGRTAIASSFRRWNMLALAISRS